MFEAVILAGGMGTRLKSVTGELPKPMVDVCGTPFLYRLMQRLESQGCSRIVLSLGYRADYIISKIKSDKPVACIVDFAVETIPLGTGGAIKLAANYITEKQFIVLNGDTFCEVDYKALVDYSQHSDLVICGGEVEEISRYGTLSLDANNYVLSMNEKGETGKGIINTGIYVLTVSEISEVKADKFSFEEDFIQTYHSPFKAYVSDGYFVDIGIPEDYYKFCEKIK